MIFNKGEFKEAQLATELNGKKVNELSPHLQGVVRFIFPNSKNEDIVYAEQIDGTMKPDFSISINGEKHYISMKSGNNTIVHQEYINNFIKLLRDYGFNDYSLKTILYFQYGDGTLDGTGKERMSYATLRKKLENAFIISNKTLNHNKKIVIEMVDRFLFKGSHDDYITADYLYHGDVYFGNIVSRSQVMKHLEFKNWDFYEALHIGPILFRPHARYYKKEIKRASYRSRVEFYWPTLLSDMHYIRTHYIQ